MIKIEEILSNIDNYDIIDPFSFKYVTPIFKLEHAKDLVEYKCKCFPRLEFIIDLSSYSIAKDNNERVTKYSIPIYNYLKILEKIYSDNKNICFQCKKISELNYCCNLCHEWFCDSCTLSHLQKANLDFENLKNDFTFKFDFKQYLKMKFFTLKDIQKDWRICECKKGGGDIICYCRHGLRCKNCLCTKCNNENNEYKSYNYRFFHLDLIFLETELKNYKNKQIDKINKYIKDFNDKIARVFEEGFKIIENEQRKKRFKKHFYKIRNFFISYFKLEVIVTNILEKNRNYNLIQLFKLQKYFNMFIKYKYNNKLSLDENISILSNILATKNPLCLVEKKVREKSSLIEKYQSKNEENEKNNDSNEIELPYKAYFYYDYENINEFNNYVNNRNIFHFETKRDDDDDDVQENHEDTENKVDDEDKEDKKNKEDNGVNEINESNKDNNFAFSIEFIGKNNNIETKQELLFSQKYYPVCYPLFKLEDGKWVFQIIKDINDKKISWILLLNENKFLKNTFQIVLIINSDTLDMVYEFEKQNISILYEETKYNFDNLYNSDMNKIAILDLLPPYNIKFINIPGVDVDNFFILENYKNKMLISCTRPYLTLLLLDYKLKQIDTIIELVNPIIPEERPFLYVFIPYISEIKELGNGKLLLIGNQRYDGYYPRPNKEYSFAIIYDFNKFCIEKAENEKPFGEWANVEIYLF